MRDREAKRDEVRRVLSGSQWAKLQLYLTLWPRTLEEIDGLNKPITKHARKVLAKGWKKPAKLGRHLGSLDSAQRHEMRKALKKLRYQAEFMAPLFDKRECEQFISQLKALQDVFGYINDATMVPRDPARTPGRQRRGPRRELRAWPSQRRGRTRLASRRQGVAETRALATVLGLTRGAHRGIRRRLRVTHTAPSATARACVGLALSSDAETHVKYVT
jgi:hypothetical protein